MERPWHSQGAMITFATVVAACVVAIIVLVIVEIRRREATLAEGIGALAALAGFAGLLLGVVYGKRYVLARLAIYPEEVRERVLLRISVLTFLFWFVFSSALGVLGMLGLAASFAVVGLGPRADRASWLCLAPFPKAYWTVVTRRGDLSRWARVRISIRHAVFSLALVVTAGIGLLIAFGLPGYWMGVGLALVVIVLVVINPHRSDGVLAQRLAEAVSTPLRVES